MDHVYDLAMGIEFIHTATLVHDDLIDRSPTRRGMTTLHETMGPDPAIIIGDYYFAKGANLIAGIGEPAIDAAISNTVMTICMGELLQMTSKDDYDQSLADYHRKIERKTATLVATCCFCGAVVGGSIRLSGRALQRYGHKLGMAFQIADDLLDYVATEAELGKPVGADLRQGTVTLPFMLALQDPVVGPELAPSWSAGPGVTRTTSWSSSWCGAAARSRPPRAPPRSSPARLAPSWPASPPRPPCTPWRPPATTSSGAGSDARWRSPVTRRRVSQGRPVDPGCGGRAALRCVRAARGS